MDIWLCWCICLFFEFINMETVKSVLQIILSIFNVSFQGMRYYKRALNYIILDYSML